MDFGYYDNGQWMFHGVIEDGKLEGELNRWFENGQLQWQLFVKDGKFEGELNSWFENGQLQWQLFMKDEKFEGEQKGWTETGQLVINEFYKDGKLVTTNSKFFRGFYRLQTLWREYKERERIWYRKMAYLVGSRVLKLAVTNGLVGEIANAV